jgi:NodT family efflux transporter outer membrane factor (OMF) lipoprotein
MPCLAPRLPEAFKAVLMMRRTLLCLLAASTTACAPQPRLAVAPGLLSSDWQGDAGPVAQAAEDRSLAAAFGSEALTTLIARAEAANADIAIARTRIEQARAQLRVARAAMLPVVSASAGLSANRSDAQDRSAFDFSDAFAGLDVAYDLDLFGGRRAERRAARDRVTAAAFDRDATALAVEAEVASGYLQYLALADRLALLDRNLAGARELERIVGIRFREGVASKVDTGLQAIEVRQLEAERLRLIEAQARTRNALAVLVGEEAPRFHLIEASLGTLSIPAIRPVQPAELLVRRPDIRAAEARIRAASGDVASARAAFFPTIRLSASALGQAAALSGPFAATVNAGAGLLAPIFGRGRLRGELAGATATQAETVEVYRRTLLTALAEAEDALAGVEQSARRQQLIDQVVAEAREALRLRRLQYLEGEADLRDVVDAQRLLVQAEDARAISIQERMEAAIDLYRAMGGSPRS